MFAKSRFSNVVSLEIANDVTNNPSLGTLTYHISPLLGGFRVYISPGANWRTVLGVARARVYWKPSGSNIVSESKIMFLTEKRDSDYKQYTQLFIDKNKDYDVWLDLEGFRQGNVIYTSPVTTVKTLSKSSAIFKSW